MSDMSSSPLISEPTTSDQSSPSLLSTSGVPLEESISQSSSPSLLPSITSPGTIISSLETPTIVNFQSSETQVNTSTTTCLISECHSLPSSSSEVVKETNLHEPLNLTPVTNDNQSELDLKEEESMEVNKGDLKIESKVTTIVQKPLDDLKHEVDQIVEQSMDESELEQPLMMVNQETVTDLNPVEETLKEQTVEPLLEPESKEGKSLVLEPMEIDEFKPHFSTEPIKLPPAPAPSQQSTVLAAQSPPSYHLKWIKMKGNKCPIVTQNENGPCPLIAIINVLLVKGRLRLPSMMEVITANQLIEYLGDCILENIPKGLKEEDQLNYEQNMHDAIAILPKLQTGLDVNVRFTGVSDFEYTPELIFFDLLHIPLYHGWLVDPADIETATSIGNLSYNQLVDKIITHKTSTRPELAFEALIVEHFLERTASQLTYHGLEKLNSTLKDGELSVLFRNNHFITLLKFKDQLYQLVTDQGFLTESRVVWETLNNIENDGLFVDGDFIPVPPKSSLTAEDQQVQVDQDYLIALSLQEEQKKEFEKEKEWETYKTENGLNELSDEEFARKLQEEEKRKAGQLTNYQEDSHNRQSSQNELQSYSSHDDEQQSSDTLRSPHSGNRRSHSLPSRKNSNKPDDKSNARCSMM